MSSPYFAGLDIGGTSIKVVLVDAAGKQRGNLLQLSSKASSSHADTFEQLGSALREVALSAGIAHDQIRAVGLDVPAPCCDGVIWRKANLSADWVGVNIRDELSARLRRPVYMTNDGSAAAFGEYVLRDHEKKGLLYVAPGTGLAGGLVLADGSLFEGANGLALEIGHVSVPFRERGRLPGCTCGRVGCVEAWVSLMAIRRVLQHKLSTRKHRRHPLNSGGLTIAQQAYQLRDYAERKDRLALEIFRKQAHVLGYALGDQASELDPGLIVIGGGLAETETNFRDWYLDCVREGFLERAAEVYVRSPIPPFQETTRFEWAVGGDASGALGVAHKAMTLV